MMRTNDALRRFKGRSKSFKIRKQQKEPDPVPVEDMDVNWNIDD